MEVGRMVIDASDTARQVPGKTPGSWSLYGSGNGLGITARELLNAPESDKSLVRDFLRLAGKANIKDITGEDLANVKVYDPEHPLLKAMLDQWQHHVAIGLANLIHITGTMNVVIGGGPAKLLDFNALRQDVYDRLNFIPEIKDRLDIRPAQLEDKANQLGAMVHAAQTYKKPANTQTYSMFA
jgi:predicted NBD/HSP70 family sugar kinase